MSAKPPLSPSSWKVFQALSITLLPADLLQKYPLESIGFNEIVFKSVRRTPYQTRLFLKAALFIFQAFSVLRYGTPFTRLNAANQNAYFQSWFKSGFYLAYLLMRPLLVFIYSAFYSHPSVASELGFTENIPKAWAPSKKPEAILDAPKTDAEMNVDVCVIGSGAGGAVVAKELAEKGHSVLILEEGKYYPIEYFKNTPTIERNGAIYRDAGLFATFGKPMILLPTGISVGGTTLINSGTCFRTPDSVLDEWRRDYGLDSFNSENLKPYFEKIERILHIEEVSEELLGNNNRIIRRGIEKLGWSGKPLLRNAAGCKGTGVCIFGCPEGAKQSMETSFLPLAFKAGAKLYPNCRVEKINHRGSSATEIIARFTDPATGAAGARLKVAARQIVVACGTLSSPSLLRRSGIARGCRALGKNLSIHPTAKVMGIFEEVVDGFKGVPQAFSLTDFEKDGLMFESVFFPPWLLSTSMWEAQEKHAEIMRAYRHIGIFGFLVHDDSRGSVREGFNGEPVVFYSLGDREKALFVKGLKILTRLFFAAGAKVVYPTLRSLPEIHSFSEIENLNPDDVKLTDIESAAFHPLGTCRMGHDPKQSVVDDQGKVHGFDNLWVADGSIFPTSLGVNPQVSIMAFAARAADIIHQSASA